MMVIAVYIWISEYEIGNILEKKYWNIEKPDYILCK